MSSLKRHFTVVEGSKEHGLYISSSPSSAARKIVSKLCSSNKSKKVQFFIREITQGSKKKTYGPYLGEMKKLAKPIELKGRVIKYAPSVYLDKKKSAKNTVKKNGKKMKGGFSILGKVETGDFYFDEETLKKLTPYNLNTVDPVKLKKNIYGKKYLFFGNRINLSRTLWADTQAGKHYLYVAYTSGFGNSKVAKFRHFINPSAGYISVYNNANKKNNISEVLISTIQKEYLEKLKNFIEEQRGQEPTFCSTIYDAVSQELKSRPNQ
jgi:hypothetical protein